MKERTFSTVNDSEGQRTLRVAEHVFFLSKFTAGGACATQGTGGVRAESNLDKNEGAALVAHGVPSLRISGERAAAMVSGFQR